MPCLTRFVYSSSIGYLALEDESDKRSQPPSSGDPVLNSIAQAGLPFHACFDLWDYLLPLLIDTIFSPIQRGHVI